MQKEVSYLFIVALFNMTSPGHLDFGNKRKEAIIVYQVNPQDI